MFDTPAGGKILQKKSTIGLKRPHRTTTATSTALEWQEAKTVWEWAQWAAKSDPRLKMLYHVPNELIRPKTASGRRALEIGACPGVPDWNLDYPARGYHSLRIEQKTSRGRVAKSQSQWLKNHANTGNCAVLARGVEETIDAIKWYLSY